jgi:hypothetical protein
VIQARQEELPMSDQFWLTKAQLKRIESFSPGRVAFRAWTTQSGPPDRVMIDSTHFKAHRTVASLLKRGIHPVSSAARKAG